MITMGEKWALMAKQAIGYIKIAIKEWPICLG